MVPPVVSTNDNPRLRIQLAERLRPLLTPPDSMAPPRWVTAEVCDGGLLIGGAIGMTAGLWLTIDLLWVREPNRRAGIGTSLVRSLEREAAARGCVGATVETTSEAARSFYERVGYRTMLACEEAEPGLVRTTLQRRF